MTALNFQGTVQFRRGNASDWTTANPVLAAGELGVELDTNRYKIGNGTSTWGALPYASSPALVTYATYAAAIAAPPTQPGYVRVTADETNGGFGTNYFYNGSTFEWLVSV